MVFGILETVKAFLDSLPIPTNIALGILFIIFLIIAYKFFKTLINTIASGIVGALVPLFSNQILGTTYPISIETLLIFAEMGMTLAIIYFFLKGIYSIIKYATWPFRRGENKQGKQEEWKNKKEEK